MRSRTISGLVMAGLLLLVPASARSFEPDADKAAPKVAPSRPALQIRLAPLDDLIGDLRYVVKKLGREEEGKQIEEMLKARTGPKGLEGVDTKKPIGLVGTLAKRLDQSELLFLLPIADEKTFLAFLDPYKPKKEKDGTYSMSLENVLFPVLFRFAHGYLYGTLKFTATTNLPPADKLPKPEIALGAGTGTLSLALNLDAVPVAVRKAIIPAVALHLGNLKDKEIPGATEKQKALRDGALDELMRVVKQLVEDGASMKGQFDLDRKADALGLAVHIDGPKDSNLAKDIQALGSRTSLGPAIIGKDSVMGGYINLPIPANLRKLLDPVVDEFFETSSTRIDDAVKALLKPSLDALKPALKADSLAMAADIRGPAKSGKYSLVVSARITKGEALEKAVKNLVAKIPAESNHLQFETDVAKAEGVNIHQLTPESQTAQATEMFGKQKVFVALRKDAVFVTAGDAGLDRMKAALAVKRAKGKLLHLQLAMSKIGILGEMHPTDTKALSDKAFGDKEGDKVSLTLDGGDKLDLRLSVDLAVLKFAFLVDQATKEK
jgi:hypothetical protein